jgi:hypothetical protein
LLLPPALDCLRDLLVLLRATQWHAANYAATDKMQQVGQQPQQNDSLAPDMLKPPPNAPQSSRSLPPTLNELWWSTSVTVCRSFWQRGIMPAGLATNPTQVT